MENQVKITKWKVYLWIISFLRPHMWSVLTIIFSGIIISISELMIPKYIQFFIDNILFGKKYISFYYLSGLMAITFMIMGIASNKQSMHEKLVKEKAARDLQYTIFQHLRKLGFPYFESHPVGETLSLLNTEVSAMQEIYRFYLPSFIQNSLFTLLSLIMLSTISFKLTLIIIPPFVLYYLLGPYFEKKSAVYTKLMSEKRVHFNRQVYESISALTEFRAYACEAWDLKRILEKLNSFNHMQLMVVLFSYLRGGVRRVCSYIGAIFVFIYSAYLIQHQELSIGGFIAFILLYFITMFRLTIIITNTTEQSILILQGEVLYKLINQIPDFSESKETKHISNVKGEITFEDVHFNYSNCRTIIEGFNLTILVGERVAIVGTSGNGKTTLLKLISRFYDPVRGKILLDKVPLKELSYQQIRENIGFVFQETYLFGTTVMENIRFANPHATDEEIIEAAKAAYAHDFIIQLPNGYHTMLGERGSKLSGGQKQRISIARMFVKKPAIIVLDEATSALDNSSEREIQNALENLLKGKTTITVAHRLSTIKNYDRIIVIHEGKNFEMGSYNELLELKGIFYHLVEGKNGKGSQSVV